MTPRLGSTFGRYRIDSILGRGANRDLALIDPDRPIDISSVERLTTSFQYQVHGTWIGKTDAIVFAQGDDYPLTSLYTMDARGGPTRELVDGRGAEFLPDVSPDGRFVVYSAGPGGQEGSESNLYAIPVRGNRDPRQLTSGIHGARQADWGVLLIRPEPAADPTSLPSGSST